MGLVRFFYLALASFYVPLIAHEFGHLLGGLLQGWHFRRFAIWPIALDRVRAPNTKRWHLALSRLRQAGQCNLDPPAYGATMFRRYFWYVAAGPLFGTLVTLALVVAAFVPATAPVRGFLIAASVWGVYLNGMALLPVFGESDGRSLARLKSEAQGRQFAALMYASVRQRHEGSDLYLSPQVLRDMEVGHPSDAVHLGTLNMAYYYHLHQCDTGAARNVLTKMQVSAALQGEKATANAALEHVYFTARFDPTTANLGACSALIDQAQSSNAPGWQAPQARARTEAAFLIASGNKEAARVRLTPLVTEELRAQARHFKHLYGQVVARDIIEMFEGLLKINSR